MRENQIVVPESDYTLFNSEVHKGKFSFKPVLVLKDTARYWISLFEKVSREEFSKVLCSTIKLEGTGANLNHKLDTVTVIAWVSPTEYYTVQGDTVMFHYSVPSDSLNGLTTSCDFGRLYREKDTIFVTQEEIDAVDDIVYTHGLKSENAGRLYLATRSIKDVTRSFPSKFLNTAKAYQVVLNKIKSANTLQSLETPNVKVVSELPAYLKWHENGLYPFEIEKFLTPTTVAVINLQEQLRVLKENYDFLNDNFKSVVAHKTTVNNENSRLRSENSLLRKQVELQEQKIRFLSEFVSNLSNVELVSTSVEEVEEV